MRQDECHRTIVSLPSTTIIMPPDSSKASRCQDFYGPPAHTSLEGLPFGLTILPLPFCSGFTRLAGHGYIGGAVTLEWLRPTPCRSSFFFHSFLLGRIPIKTTTATTACGGNKQGVLASAISFRCLIDRRNQKYIINISEYYTYITFQITNICSTVTDQ